MNQKPSLSNVLKEQGYSSTKTRKIIFDALSDTGPITMSQLVNKVRHKTDRASVYRTVELFEKLGIITRIQIGWKYKLELSDKFTEHHHHATCLNCGVVTTLEEDETIESRITSLAAHAGFTKTNHSLEIRGYCKRCSLELEDRNPKLEV